MTELPYFMEPVDSIPESSLKWTTAGVVVLLQTHYPYKQAGCKEILIPRGAMGSLDGKYIRWQLKINLYDVVIAEIQLLLQQVGEVEINPYGMLSFQISFLKFILFRYFQASFGLSAVKVDTLTRVQRVLGFLELIMPQLEVQYPSYSQRFRQLILSIVERFGPLSSSTYELLASCLNCLAGSVNRANASEVAAKLFGSSVLPSMERQLPSGSVDVVLPGVIGTVLAGVECPQGTYPLTSAFLKLSAAFIRVNIYIHLWCNLFIILITVF